MFTVPAAGHTEERCSTMMPNGLAGRPLGEAEYRSEIRVAVKVLLDDGGD